MHTSSTPLLMTLALAAISLLQALLLAYREGSRDEVEHDRSLVSSVCFVPPRLFSYRKQRLGSVVMVEVALISP